MAERAGPPAQPGLRAWGRCPPAAGEGLFQSLLPAAPLPPVTKAAPIEAWAMPVPGPTATTGSRLAASGLLPCTPHRGRAAVSDSLHQDHPENSCATGTRAVASLPRAC